MVYPSISSALSSSLQMLNDSMTGVRPDQEYAMATAKKTIDQIKLEGQAVTKLIDSVPISDEVRGTRFSAFA